MAESQQESQTPFADCNRMTRELERQPDILTFFKVIWCSIKEFFVERPGQIIGSAFILIMLWGTHGNLELLEWVWDGWRAPGTDLTTRPEIIPGVPWDYELISFWSGALLLVGVPILLIKFVYKQDLSDYGLGLPPRDRMRFALLSFVILMAFAPLFAIGAQDSGVQEIYPFYRPFDSTAQFILYELTYLPFFIAIEFIFRGYLLFGLAGVRDTEVVEDITNRDEERESSSSSAGSTDVGTPGVYYFARYALLIQMLSYTAWHLGKPLPELWGTLFWGLAAGAVAYASRSLWLVILAHWLLNVFMDALIVDMI